MSWLSELLQDAGISKETQRGVTNTVATVLAPATSGLSLLARNTATTVRNQAAAVVQGAVDDAAARLRGANAAVTTANAGANFAAMLDNPLLIFVGGTLIVLLLRE